MSPTRRPAPATSTAVGGRGRIHTPPAGYASGPDAMVRATAEALTRARALAETGGNVALVLGRGRQRPDRRETAAASLGRDLAAERVVVVPIGGAHAIGRALAAVDPLGDRVRLAGLCDVREQELFRRGLARRTGPLRDRADLERAGFHLCVDDLEDELLRALEPDTVEALFHAHGDLESFRRMQRQPAWRGRPPRAQMRRFLRSVSHRKPRYAQLLVREAVARGTLPRPLEALLADLRR